MISDVSWAWVSLIKITSCIVNQLVSDFKSISQKYSVQICWLYFASLATPYWLTQTYSSSARANDIADSRTVHWSAVQLSESKYSGGLGLCWVVFHLWCDVTRFAWPGCYRESYTGVVTGTRGTCAVYTDNVPPVWSAGPWCLMSVGTEHSPPVCTETARGSQVVHCLWRHAGLTYRQLSSETLISDCKLFIHREREFWQVSIRRRLAPSKYIQQF